MQVTQTHADGLKREFEIVLPALDLSSRMDGQLNEMAQTARIKGFRPGKVPVAHLKRLYGRSVMAEVLQKAVEEARSKMIADNKLRLAGEPRFDVDGEGNVLERALAATGDLKFKVALEVLPKVEVGAFDDIAVEKLVADVPDEEVDRFIGLIADQNRSYEPKTGEGATAQAGDKASVDFAGTVDGEPFEGGKGTDVDLVLGSGSFIPGFEDGVLGMAVGETRTVDVTFPDDYGAANLAGKPASFAVTLKGVAAPGALTVDDDFAKGFGMEGLDNLKASVRGNIERDYSQASRTKWKRALLDTLDKRYQFELPQGLVDQEFDQIWRQVEAEQKRSGKGFADENTTEEAARADYRRIAERRVRLGLVLAEIGEANGISVTQEELTEALMQRVRQFPGEEKQAYDVFRNNPQMMAQVQAPIFEDKVIDHILSKANVTERKVTREELTADDEALDPAA